MNKVFKYLEAHKNVLKIIIGIVALIIIVFAGLFAYTATWYKRSLHPVDVDNQESVTFQVKKGETTAEIATNLHESDLIHNIFSFKWYVKINDLDGKIQSGFFDLNQSLGVDEIVNILVDGRIINQDITILPSKRLDEIKLHLIKQGFSQAIIDDALDIKHYQDHPLADYWQETQTLEGFLYPETFFVTDFLVEDAIGVVKRSLDKFAEVLDDQELKDGFTKQGLTVRQAIILASIIEQESDEAQHQPSIAQVFLARLRQDHKLESDVTFLYAAEAFGLEKKVDLDNPYNTRRFKGLPPGPIGNVNRQSLQAVANPAQTDYFFFLAGDDGQMYFNKTLKEHQADRNRYCRKACQLDSN